MDFGSCGSPWISEWPRRVWARRCSHPGRTRAHDRLPGLRWPHEPRDHPAAERVRPRAQSGPAARHLAARARPRRHEERQPLGRPPHPRRLRRGQPRRRGLASQRPLLLGRSGADQRPGAHAVHPREGAPVAAHRSAAHLCGRRIDGRRRDTAAPRSVPKAAGRRRRRRPARRLRAPVPQLERLRRGA